MKKLFIVIVLAGLGYAAWKKLTEADVDRKLWDEVTDAVRGQA